MRKAIIFWLILLLLALNCNAVEPIRLSGIGGKTILAQVASTNITIVFYLTEYTNRAIYKSGDPIKGKA